MSRRRKKKQAEAEMLQRIATSLEHIEKIVVNEYCSHHVQPKQVLTLDVRTGELSRVDPDAEGGRLVIRQEYPQKQADLVSEQ